MTCSHAQLPSACGTQTDTRSPLRSCPASWSSRSPASSRVQIPRPQWRAERPRSSLVGRDAQGSPSRIACLLQSASTPGNATASLAHRACANAAALPLPRTSRGSAALRLRRHQAEHGIESNGCRNNSEVRTEGDNCLANNRTILHPPDRHWSYCSMHSMQTTFGCCGMVQSATTKAHTVGVRGPWQSSSMT